MRTVLIVAIVATVLATALPADSSRAPQTDRIAVSREGLIPAGKASLFFREIGQGPPIIVLHGGPDFDHGYLLPDLDRLADAFRLIYYDQRGRGRSADHVQPEDVTLASDIDDVDKVRQHFHLESAALLGHSWGAVLALEYALRYPTRVSHLILMNPAPASASDLAVLRKAYVQKLGADMDRQRAIMASAAYKEGDPEANAARYGIHFKPALKRPEDYERLMAAMKKGFVSQGKEGAGDVRNAFDDFLRPTTGAAAQDFPDRPVRLIEPFGAGGGVDVMSRPVAQKLSELWGQPVSIENHTGAGSTAAPALVAKAPPDGYTLLVNSSAQAYAAVLRKDAPYDPLKDFIPVAPLTSQGYVLVAGKAAGVATVAELVAAAKARPDSLSFGSPGVGSGAHFGILKFNLEAGIRSVHVCPVMRLQAIANTIAGKTAYLLAPIPLAVRDIRAGSLVPLGVSGARRSPLLPEVPTVAEAGVAGFDYTIWYGVWAPARTPGPVVDKIARDIARAMASPDLQEWLVNHGGQPMTMTQPEFARFVQTESARASQIIKAAGLTPR